MPRGPIQDADRQAVATFLEQHWPGGAVFSHGRLFHPHREQGFVELRNGKIVGLLTYAVDHGVMRIITLNRTLQGEGIGTALTLMTIDHARQNNVTRIWLTTTNDNLPALRFYQRLGFRIIQVSVGAMDKARKLKPDIPEVGYSGIPIHDEIVLELYLMPHIYPGQTGVFPAIP